MRSLGLLFLLALAAPSIRAQAPEKADLLRELRAAEDHILALADAIPADKYSWRPAPGVRSVSEVLVHLGQGNHMLLEVTGVPRPKEMTPALEKSLTEKGKVIEMVRASYAKAVDAIEKSTPADWNRSVNFFISPATVRSVYLRITAHSTEHLGQLIAYARVNGIVPPWSR